MILSASRRTDIPAFYSNWFFNRLKEGYVDVRNPMNYHRISRIRLNPEVVDCIVFWTKNPRPMIDKLDELKNYHYYFQFTLNPYGKDLEVYVPTKSNNIIDTFKMLSDKIGPDRIIWRYDPIFMSQKIDIKYHLTYFEKLTKILHRSTQTCVISFLDLYKKTETNLKPTSVRTPSEEEILRIASDFSEIAKVYNLRIKTCSETVDLSKFGIEHNHCIDKDLIEKLVGKPMNLVKDKNQRKECGCVESIDIGEYNTCMHNCLYCYATFNRKTAITKNYKHNDNSSLLVGTIGEDDVVKDRVTKSLIINDLFTK